MATAIPPTSWEDDLQQYLLHAAIHDKRNQTQNVMNALREETNQQTPCQTPSAYSSSITDYLQRVRVVGAEEATTLGSNSQGQQQKLLVDTELPYIISIRGFPDCALVKYLGKRFHIAPDILLGHLPYPPTFEVRPLPSFQGSVLNILMISTGFCSGNRTQSRGTKKQIEVDATTEQHNKYLFENNLWGPEQCHMVNLHGPQFFSVEQRVTFIVHEKGGHKWSGIVLSNSGIEDSSSPWCFDTKSTSARFLPLKAYGNLPLHPVASRYERNAWQNLSQRHPDPCLSRVHRGITMSEREQQLCLQDPRVFASDLLKTSALSWRLFLSFLHSQLQSISGDPGAKVDHLHRDKEVLDRARLYFRDATAFMKHRNKLGWPSCQLPEDRAAVDAIMTSLLEDFKDLEDEAASLCQICNDSIGLEMNMISILDSKKSIEQADRVQKLTFLAYLFIPLSFITGIFGMNVKQVNGSIPELWLYFAIAVPTAIVFALIPLWQDMTWMFAKAKLAMQHVFVGYGVEEHAKLT